MKKDLTNIIGYIYKITSPNNKIYIGQTINKKQRKYNYKKGFFKQQIKLWNNCQKHLWNPIDTFEIIEVCECGFEKNHINEREQYWINYYDSFKNGLNCNEGGNGNLGYIPNLETRKKMSESAKKNSEYISKRMILLHSGVKLSDGHKNKISKTLKGVKRSDDFKKIMSEIGKTRLISDETKRKISETKKNVPSKKRIKVGQYDINDILIKIWESISQAEKELNITKGKISKVCLGKRKKTGGFKWKYIQ